MAIDQARLLTLHAAWALDRHGTPGALTDVARLSAGGAFGAQGFPLQSVADRFGCVTHLARLLRD